MTFHLMHLCFHIRNLPTTSSSNSLDSQPEENILMIRSFNGLFIDTKKIPLFIALGIQVDHLFWKVASQTINLSEEI